MEKMAMEDGRIAPLEATRRAEEEVEETEEGESSNSKSSDKGSLDYDLKSQFEKLGEDACQDENYYSSECNKFLLKKEVIEGDYLSKNPYLDVDLYPNLSDTNFNIKIANKEEFSETKYEGPDFSKSLKEQADILANADFELQPHQAFIKNFMSFQTPYNSLLLYHGLGSGKTCSAIGVCEEMRDYMKQMGISKRIMIVGINLIVAFIWTAVLGWFCKNGFTSVSWVLVLFPYIMMLLVFFGVMKAITNSDIMMIVPPSANQMM